MQQLFQVGLGLADDNIFYLSGTGAPLGTTGDITFDAPKGSYYSDVNTGITYKKIATNGTAADWAAGVSASELAALQAEVDRLEAATGMNADGTFSGFTGTNYLNSAGNLKEAAAFLDTAIKAAQDAVAAEAAARQAADAALDSRISQEIADRSTADAALSAAIAAEATSRQAADATEAAARIAGDDALRADLNAEIAARQAADTAEANARTTADTAEAAARVAGDAALQAQIDSLSSGSTAAVQAVQAEVDRVETAIGLNEDGTFSAPTGTNYLDSATSVMSGLGKLDVAIKTNADAIAAEATARAAADTAEAAARTTADQSLAGAIDAEIANRQAADALEAATRAAADAALQTEVNAIETSLGFVDAAGAFVALSGSNFMADATDAKGALLALDAQVKTNSTAIQVLQSQFAGVDAALQAELDRLEAASGVNVDGSFVPFAGTNYLDAVSTIRAGLVALDGQVKVNADAIANEAAARASDVAGLTSAVSAEAAARAAADAAVQSELDATQAGAGLNADGSYTAPTLSTYLGGATSLKDADSKLDAGLKALADTVAAISGGGSGSLAALEAALAAETTARQQGDATNAAAIAAETAARQAADAAETAARQQGDADNAAAIAAEAAARQADVSGLTAAIAAETAARQAADAALSTEDEAIRAYVGKNAAGVVAPSYTSTTVVANGDNLTAAVGKLDAAIKSLSEGVESVTVTENITAAAVADSVDTHGVGLVKWLVYVQTPTAKQAVEILATHDGSKTQDATSTSATTYARLRQGAIPGLAFDVTVSGSGASQKLNLVVSSNTAVTVRTVRDVVGL